MPGVPPARYAYLGPEGTFTEQALRSLPAAAKADLQPCSTVTVALDAVRGGEADGAVVPIENSVEGSVPVTLDELATGEPLMITREMTVPIAFSLLARPGVGPTTYAGWRPTRTPRRRPGAGCALHLPGRRGRAHHLDRARRVHARPSPTPTWDAAISAPVAAEHYRLATLATGIGDNPDALTRFVLVSRPGPPPPPTGRDKTSLVAFMREDHPGALLEILDQLTDARREHDPHRVAADRRRARQLLLLHRLRGARRRRPGRRGADGPAPGVRRRPVPRLLRAARRRRARHPGRAPRTASSTTPPPGSRASATDPDRFPRLGRDERVPALRRWSCCCSW